MIKNLGAKYIILGHSENRANGDTDITINEKINSALKQKLTVIFCIGETLSQKKDLACFESEKRFYEIGSIEGLEELELRLRGMNE